MPENHALPFLVEPPRSRRVVRELPLTELPSDDSLGGPAPEASLVASIGALGVLQPVILATGGAEINNASSYDVIAGRRRIKAARRAGLEMVPAHVYGDLDAAVQAMMTLAENHARHENPGATYAALRALLPLVTDPQDVGRVVGLPKGALQRILRLGNLVPELAEAFENGSLRASVAEAAAKLPPETQARLVAVFSERGKLALKDVAEAQRARATAAVAGLSALDLGLDRELPAPGEDGPFPLICNCPHLAGCPNGNPDAVDEEG